MVRYLLLFGKTSAKKPTHYCPVHKCGVTRHVSKRKCWRCKRLRTITAALAEEIKTGRK